MAVSKLPQNSKLVIKVQTGVNAQGTPVYRQRSYANIKAAAADADIYVSAMASLDYKSIRPKVFRD